MTADTRPSLPITHCPKCQKRIGYHCKSPTCTWWLCSRDVAAGATMGCGSYGYDNGRVYQIDRQSQMILALLDIVRG